MIKLQSIYTLEDLKCRFFLIYNYLYIKCPNIKVKIIKLLQLNKKVLKYNELAIEIKNAVKQVKKENYKNYFENAYNKDAYKDYVKKDSTLKKKLKNYKD